MKVTRCTQEAWKAARATWPGTFAEWHAHHKKERRERERERYAAFANAPWVLEMRRRLEHYIMYGSAPAPDGVHVAEEK